MPAKTYGSTYKRLNLGDGVMFDNGRLTTDNPALQARIEGCKSFGLDIWIVPEGEAPAAPADGVKTTEQELQSATKAQLVELAAVRGIVVDKRATKEVLIAAILHGAAPEVSGD